MPLVNREEFLSRPFSVETGQFQITHGHTSSRTGKTLVSPTYRSWMKMKDRVFNPNHVAYMRYGGRGISICERWVKSFENFLSDMGERPKGKSLDRRDNGGNYTPENCYWATSKEQSRNTCTNRLLTFHGLTLSVAEWAERFYIHPATIYQRLKRGWSIERALVETVSLSRRDHAVR